MLRWVAHLYKSIAARRLNPSRTVVQTLRLPRSTTAAGLRRPGKRNISVRPRQEGSWS